MAGSFGVVVPDGDVVREAGCAESRLVRTGACGRDADRSSELRLTGGGTTSGGVVVDAAGG